MTLCLDSPKTWRLPFLAWVAGLAASCAVSPAIAEDLFDAQRLLKQVQWSAAGAPVDAHGASPPHGAQALFGKGTGATGEPSRRSAEARSLLAATTSATAAEEVPIAAGKVEPDAAAPDDPIADPATLPKAIPGWELIFSPYTTHYHSGEEYRPVVLLGLIKGLEGRWLAGAVAFSNSFGQASAYAYLGQRYLNPFGFEKWYLQWSAGLLYGYVGKYEDKVPYNHNGFSPGIVPSVGYQFSKHVYGELEVLGTAGLMFSVVFPLPRGTP